MSYSIITTTGLAGPMVRNPVADTDPYAALAQDIIDAVQDGDSEICTLVDDLLRACLYASDRRGIGSDRVWEAIGKIKMEMEAH